MAQETSDCSERILALEFIRKMRGGSQPILVSASDRQFYVVKFVDNLQGPNVAFNEAIGCELFRQVGLPVPEWTPVYVSDEFLDKNPECWIEGEHGRFRPRAGWCFGSRFMGLNGYRLFEILPVRSFNRIRNRKGFWIAWVLDVLCGHSDNRQAVFVKGRARSLVAYFIDHGHLFGGPKGNASPLFWACRYLDREIYPYVNAEDAHDIVLAIEQIDMNSLIECAKWLPFDWRTSSALSRLELFGERISRPAFLRNAVCLICGLKSRSDGCDDRRFVQSDIRTQCAGLYAQVPESSASSRRKSWADGPAGDQRRRKAQSLRLA